MGLFGPAKSTQRQQQQLQAASQATTPQRVLALPPAQRAASPVSMRV